MAWSSGLQGEVYRKIRKVHEMYKYMHMCIYIYKSRLI